MEPFKLIVAGGRGFNHYERLSQEIVALAHGELNSKSISIVSGMAKGADAMGYQFARTNNVICHEFPANWDRYGKKAGFLRNIQMGDFADGLLAFWDGHSKGTAHMINYMESLNKMVRLVMYPIEETV